MLEPGHIQHAQTGQYVVERFLGRGKSGYSYLAQQAGVEYVLKVMHDEPVPYYTFGNNKVLLEVAAYQRLRELNVTVPDLIEFDTGQNYLIKSFVPGEVATHAIAAGEITQADIAQLLRLAGHLRKHGQNIDWFPTNFVLGPQGVIYIDYEINDFQQQWSFDDWGVWYWANTAGMRAYLNSGDILHLNADLNSGKPQQNEQNSQRVQHWLLKIAVESLI